MKGEWQETSSKKKKKQPTGNKSDSVIDIKPEKREKSKEREYNDKPDRDRENYSRNDRRNRQPPRLASEYLYEGQRTCRVGFDSYLYILEEFY